jgi:hypothetical protein
MMYIQRCLANYDINVALDLEGERNGSFAYDADCGADEYTSAGNCGVTGFDSTACPPAWMAAYVLKPGMDRFTNFHFDDLARHLLMHRPLDAGTLVIDRSSGPRQAGNVSP